MNLGKSLRAPLLMLKSVDSWLFVASFVVSAFTLQSLPTVANQTLAMVVVLAICVVISFLYKRRSGWSRRSTGVRGALSAIGVMLFVGYAICMFSVKLAGMQNIELSGSFLDQAGAALAEPKVFGGVIPFAFLGIFAAASYLGLTDVHQLESRSEA